MQSLWNEIVTDDLSVCVRDTHTGKIVGKKAMSLWTDATNPFVGELLKLIKVTRIKTPKN